MDYNEKFYEELASTNDFSLDHLAEFSDRTVIYATRQTKGHGRFERKWISSNAKNIYTSIILKPKIKLDENCILANLTQYLCVVLAETFEKYGVKASIKWPNDILINGKKISGILAQTSVKNGELQGVVLGVGINLNMTQEELVNIDQPATSLNIETRKSIDKKEFSKNLFDLFFSEYEEFLQKGFSLIKSRYCSRCDFISKEICVKNPDKARVGIAQAINDDGSLKIKFNDKNESETIRIGDVTWNY